MKIQWSELSKRVLTMNFLGVALTVLLGLPALYLTIHERAPHVVFEVESIANVFDLHRPLPELTILFKGDDIQNQGKNLQIVTVAIRNNGEENIRQGDYDQNQPFGLKIHDGQIVGIPRVLRSDSDYLTKNLAPRRVAESIVEFNKLIIERNKSFAIEFVVLHDQSSRLTFEPFGKIAGQDVIPIVNKLDEKETSFFNTVFVGGVLPNIVRFIISVALFIWGFVVLAYSEQLISKAKLKRSENQIRKYLAPVLSSVDPATNTLLRSILNLVGLNVDKLRQYAEIMRKSDEIALIAKNIDERESREHKPSQIKTDVEIIRENLTWMMKDNLFKKDNVMIANPAMLRALESLIEYILKTPPPPNRKWKRCQL